MSIGMARISIVNGSVDGVAIAANTNVPITIHGRWAPRAAPLSDAGEVEQDHEDRDLEGDPEHQEGPDQERQVVAELDQVGQAPGVNPIRISRPLGSVR